MDAIEAALTDEVWQRVRAFAVRCCRILDTANLAGDPDEMTHEAVNDTVVGKRRWNPDKCALHTHLQGVLRSRTSHACEHTRTARYVQLGGRPDNDGYDPVEVEATHAAEPVGNPEAQLIQDDLIDRTVSEMRAMARAANDNQVLQMIEAWREGVTDRHEVAARLGISVKKVKNARQRLMRMADRLPEALGLEGARND